MDNWGKETTTKSGGAGGGGHFQGLWVDDWEENQTGKEKLRPRMGQDCRKRFFIAGGVVTTGFCILFYVAREDDKGLVGLQLGLQLGDIKWPGLFYAKGKPLNGFRVVGFSYSFSISNNS